MPKSRRRFLQAAGACSVAPFVNFGSYQVFAASPRKYSARAVRLIERSLVLDMLSGLRLGFTPAAWAGTLTEKEVQDLRASGLSSLHHATGNNPTGPHAHEAVLIHLAAWNGFIGRNDALLSLVDRAEDLDRSKSTGKIAVIMGVQNSEHFRTPDDVKLFHTLGLRCSQLTYNEQNLIGTGSTERTDGGVSDFGARIIEQMNRVGMLVDVSHCGDRTTLDGIEISKTPVAITHSNCRALNNHPRLKTDEAIRALAAKGGVMGISGVRQFVRDREPTSVEHIADHIDHVVKLVGIEHVGLGTDSDLNGLDDMDKTELKGFVSGYKSSYAFRSKLDTDGFDDPLRFYNLTEVLIARGYSDANIQAVLGGNFRRLLGQVLVPSGGA